MTTRRIMFAVAVCVCVTTASGQTLKYALLALFPPIPVNSGSDADDKSASAPTRPDITSESGEIRAGAAVRHEDHPLSLTVRVNKRTAAPGESVSVDILVDHALPDVQGYQLEVRPGGGTRGRLELVDISIQDRRDYVFAAAGVDQSAFSVSRSTMFTGLPSLKGVATSAGGYLATFTFRVSDDAVGAFVIDVGDWAERGEFAQQSFLAASDFALLAIESTTPAVVEIVSVGDQSGP